MRVEIPYFSRCCCCLPLRRGILTLAYINFVLSILISIACIIGDIGIQNHYQHQMNTLYPNEEGKTYWYSYYGLFSMCRLFAALYILNAVFSIVLITGCHMKSLKSIKMFYYYGTSKSIFSIAFLLLHADYLDYFLVYEIGGILFVWLSFQAYFLLLIRSEIKKLTEENLCVRYEKTENKLAADNAVENIYEKGSLENNEYQIV